MSYEKIGLIGFGKWVEIAYLPCLFDLENSKISHVSTKSQRTLNKAKKLLGDNLKYSLNYKDLIYDNDLDIIILSIPDEIHGDLLLEISLHNNEWVKI